MIVCMKAYLQQIKKISCKVIGLDENKKTRKQENKKTRKQENRTPNYIINKIPLNYLFIIPTMVGKTQNPCGYFPYILKCNCDEIDNRLFFISSLFLYIFFHVR